MASRGPKQTVFACLAEIAQATGQAHRLELLELLGQANAACRSWLAVPGSASRTRRATCESCGAPGWRSPGERANACSTV